MHVLIQNTGMFLCDWKESTLKPLICVFIQPGHTISTIELEVQLTSAAEIGQKKKRVGAGALGKQRQRGLMCESV